MRMKNKTVKQDKKINQLSEKLDKLIDKAIPLARELAIADESYDTLITRLEEASAILKLSDIIKEVREERKK